MRRERQSGKQSAIQPLQPPAEMAVFDQDLAFLLGEDNDD